MVGFSHYILNTRGWQVWRWGKTKYYFMKRGWYWRKLSLYWQHVERVLIAQMRTICNISYFLKGYLGVYVSIFEKLFVQMVCNWNFAQMMRVLYLWRHNLTRSDEWLGFLTSIYITRTKFRTGIFHLLSIISFVQFWLHFIYMNDFSKILSYTFWELSV